MKIDEELLHASEARAATLDAKASILRPAPRQPVDAKAITRRLTYYGLGDNTPSSTEFERAIDGDDLVDAFYLARALRAADPVCRIVLRSPSGSERGHATGFMVAPGVMLTNWHVFQDGMDARFAIAEFNYTLDIRGEPVAPNRYRLRPDLLYFDLKELDYAFVAVEPSDGSRPLAEYGFHRLIPETGKAEEQDWLTVIQHPEGQRRQYAIRENQLVRKEAGEPTLWYRSDTARGSSGAPVFNDSFQVVALHHMGVAPRKGNLYLLKDGRTVPTLRGIDDEQVEWIANEGIRVSALCQHILPRLRPGSMLDDGLKNAIDGAIPDLLASVLSAHGTPSPSPQDVLPPKPAATVPSDAFATKEEVMPTEIQPQLGASLVIPLELRISLALAGPAPSVGVVIPHSVVAPPPQPLQDAVERYVKPWHDDDYANRSSEGYDENFLGIAVPAPRITDPSTAATYDGDHWIPYVHFSVCLHKKRRLAILTASNVDYRPAMRAPDPSKKYDRDSLGGLGKNDLEAWLTDPRLGEMHQIPDEFYSNDRGAFDRGHIVRRDDVCWGTTYEELRRANGDTYHLTNCSPQVAHYNQSSKSGIWGQLEEVVKANARTEQLCVFAGCVLREDDGYFTALYKNQRLKFQVPVSFWKVIIAKGPDNRLQCFGFVLEQDLSQTDLTYEFSVDASWKEYMCSLEEIQVLTGETVAFDPALHAVDQVGTAGGQEVMRQSRTATPDRSGST